MTIQIGEKIPSVLVKKLYGTSVKDFNTDQLFAQKRVVLFGLPGAFTPTCSTKHVPGYVKYFEEFKKRGIDVICLSVNDPFVMRAWFLAMHVNVPIETLCDGNATFTKALGLDMNGTAYGLGTRSQRFALYAENGVVQALAVEQPGVFEVSAAEAMVSLLEKLAL